MAKKKLVLNLWIIFFFFFTFSPLAAEKRKLTLLYTNDLHGYLLPGRDYFTPGEPKPLIGGMAYLATYVQEVRKNCAEKKVGFLLLDAGDIFHGTPEGNKTKGEAVIEIMNEIGYNASAIGNHEYAYGEDNLRLLSKEAKFPFLSCNLIDKKTKKLVDYTKPYLIQETENIKVGIIGVTTPETIRMNFYPDIQNIEFLNYISAVTEQIAQLKNRVDLIIILSHLGTEKDILLAECIPEIDLIISGHDHLILEPAEEIRPRPGKITPILQSGEHGLRVGHLDLVIDTEKNKIATSTHKLVNLFPWLYPPDPRVQVLLSKYQLQEMDQPVGYAETTLEKRKDSESAIGNLLTDAIREISAADIAIERTGSIRAGLAKGEITYRDLYSVSPFENTLVTFELSGKEIAGLLEKGIKDGKTDFQISGIKIVYTSDAPGNTRIRKIEIGGKEIDPQKKYLLATSNYTLLVWGKYSTILEEVEKYSEMKITIYEALVNYTQKYSPLIPPQGERIVKQTISLPGGKKINLNTANLKTFTTLKGIGQKKAAAIIEYREKHGPFKRIDEIMQVQGIGPGIFAKIKDYLTLGEPEEIKVNTNDTNKVYE